MFNPSRPGTGAVAAVLVVLSCWTAVGAHAQRSPADSATFLTEAAERARREATQASREHAIQLYQQALSILRALGDRRRQATVQNTIGWVHQRLSRPDTAMAYYTQALEIRIAEKDSAGAGNTLYNLATACQERDRTDSARIFYEAALDYKQKLGDIPGQAVVLSSLGLLHRILGHPDSALALLRHARDLQQRLGDTEGRAATLGYIGSTYQLVGRSDLVMTNLNQALELQHDSAGVGTALIALASAEYGQRSYDSALVHLARARELLHPVGDSRGEGTAVDLVGSVHLALGSPASALDDYAQALPLRSAAHDGRGEGATLEHIGLAHATLGHADTALAYYARALRILREKGDLREVVTVLLNTGYLYHQDTTKYNPARATAYYDSAASVVAEVGRFASDDATRVSYAEQDVALFQLWARAWLDRAPEVGTDSAAAAALAATERGRAQTLRALMRRNVDRAAGLTDDGAPIIAVGADMPAAGYTLAASLGPDAPPAISYMVTRETLFAFLVRPGHEVEVFYTAVTQDTLAALVNRLRAALGVDSAASRGRGGLRRIPGLGEERASEPEENLDPNAWRAPAARLARLLLPDELRARLPATGELIIVPGGPLFLLPFALLPLEPDRAAAGDLDAFLGLRYALRFTPSLEVLAELQQLPDRSGWSGIHRTIRGALVVGNPDPPQDSHAPILNQAQSESVWLAGRLHTDVLVGAQATETVVRAGLGSATLVHLATHAEVYASDAQVRDSNILLAPGPGQDGRLTVDEVMNQIPDMRAELVVLSACQTGIGDVKQAEGTVGLQRAFLARGVRSLVVTLWSVNDTSTKLLMERFYGGWLDRGLTAAEALRRAERELARGGSYSHPRFWAAYQATGAQSGRNPHPGQTTSRYEGPTREARTARSFAYVRGAPRENAVRPVPSLRPPPAPALRAGR